MTDDLKPKCSQCGRFFDQCECRWEPSPEPLEPENVGDQPAYAGSIVENELLIHDRQLLQDRIADLDKRVCEEAALKAEGWELAGQLERAVVALERALSEERRARKHRRRARRWRKLARVEAAKARR